MRKINELIIHCTATRPEWLEGHSADEKRDQIDTWHLARGWDGFGYHMLFDRDGAVSVGRSVNKIGAHTKGHNRNSIGIVLVGGYQSLATDKFSDHYTKEQDATLRQVIKEWTDANPDITLISGHNEYANKGCPGFNVSDWMNKPRGFDLVAWIMVLVGMIFGRNKA